MNLNNVDTDNMEFLFVSTIHLKKFTVYTDFDVFVSSVVAGVDVCVMVHAPLRVKSFDTFYN